MSIKDRDLRAIQEVRDLVEKAKNAQKELKLKSQEEIDQIVKAMADEAYKQADRFAKMAAEETGFGVYEDKIVKNKVASKSVYDYIKDMKTIGIINEDKEKRIVEIATPVGVIAGLVPSTNPTSTAIYKALIAIKSGNSVVFSPHPSALNSIKEVVDVMQKKAEECGAPKDTLTCLTIPHMDGTNALMKHKDIALILATGGSAMVKAAYSSGNPALGVGPGNVPAFIERSADIDLAVKRILASKTFDNGTVCASEQAIVTENIIKNQVQESFIKQGGYFLNDGEKEKVENVIQKANGSFNAKIAGRSAKEIALMAGIKVPEETRVLIAEERNVGIAYPFSREKLSPLLSFYSEEDWMIACDRCIEILNYGGIGHTLAIHSNDEGVIREFALKKPASRVLVNTPSSQGAVGATTNLPPAMTLGCGAAGGSATSDNVGPLNLIDIRRLAYGVKEPEDLSEEFDNANADSGLDLEKITKLIMEQLKNVK